MPKLLLARKDAKLDNDSFISKYRPRLNKVELGCSFSPEQWTDSEISSGRALLALNIIINQLNIRQIRLGLRWDKIVDENGQLSLKYYKPFLDYCILNKVDICLNIGPIKTFRWPEQHVPNKVLNSLSKIPKKGAKIILSSELGIVASEYINSLGDLLKIDYGTYELNMIKTIQIENEPYFKFGKYEWYSTDLYLYHLITNISQKFPNAGIMLNSAGRLNIQQILHMFQYLNNKQLNTYPQLTLGYDYYYKYPTFYNIPLLNILDNIILSYPWNVSCLKLLNIVNTLKFNLEVTEAQMEPWGNVKSPGNSVIDLRFVLLRCIQNLQTDDSRLLIRLWGIERLANIIIDKTYSIDHVDMIDLITKVSRAV